MRYKSNDKCITLSGRQILIFSVIAPESKYIFRFLDSTDNSSTFFIQHDENDHEATAKLNTLPQPHISLLSSGVKLVYGDKTITYYLKETQMFYDKEGQPSGTLKRCEEDLYDVSSHYNVVEMWLGDILIAQRTEKSEAELKKESLEKQMADLQQKVDEIAKEIKSL